jgi:hypothetical protein
MRQIVYHIQAVFFFAVMVIPSGVHAAFLYFDPLQSDIYRGDTITLSVRLDTDEEECVNTVDATIQYDPSIRAVDVSRGESILSLWVQDPIIDDTSHTITFAGGIPGGYCGRIAGDPKLTNVIAKLVFRSPGVSIGASSEDKKASVWFTDTTQVLLNDGLGTRAPLKTQGAELVLLDTPGTEMSDSWSEQVADDLVPPADFSITLADEKEAFSGKYFITFNTQDKQSGIDHYEVMEEPFDDFYLFRWGRADAPWVIATSPYVLEDQSLNSTIRVRAVDKAGNETMAVLVPDVALRSVSMERMVAIWTIIGVVLLMSILVGYALWRRRSEVISEYSNRSTP